MHVAALGPSSLLIDGKYKPPLTPVTENSKDQCVVATANKTADPQDTRAKHEVHETMSISPESLTAVELDMLSVWEHSDNHVYATSLPLAS